MVSILRIACIQIICLFLLVAKSHAEHLGANEAISLLDAGKMLPLEKIISLHPVLMDSRILDIQLEQEENGILIYEFEFLNKRNRVIEIDVDASTGKLIREEFEE